MQNVLDLNNQTDDDVAELERLYEKTKDSELAKEFNEQAIVLLDKMKQNI